MLIINLKCSLESNRITTKHLGKQDEHTEFARDVEHEDGSFRKKRNPNCDYSLMLSSLTFRTNHMFRFKRSTTAKMSMFNERLGLCESNWNLIQFMCYMYIIVTKHVSKKKAKDVLLPPVSVELPVPKLHELSYEVHGGVEKPIEKDQPD